MVLAISIYIVSQILRMDSLLELISSSGTSSTSVSLCPFWLKCCGTASVVLFCMPLRCSPNLSIAIAMPSLFVQYIQPVHQGCFCVCDTGSCKYDFLMRMS